MADAISNFLTLSSKYIRFRSESVTSSSPSMAGSCRRCLFGRPDAGELRRDLELIRERQQRQSVERWNYDFESGLPLPGRFDWQSVITARRDWESCGRLSLYEDRRDHDDQNGGGRLEPVESSKYSDKSAPAAITIPPQQHVIPSLTGASAAAVDVQRVPVPSAGAGKKRRRNSPRSDDGCSLKQPRHSRRRRTVARHRAQLVNTAGAARVTGR